MLLPAPTLISPRGALRRSLVVWGWGQVATGDRRGWALVAVEMLAVAALVVVGLPLASGTDATLLLLGGCGFGAAWVAVALHAYRCAVHRRVTFGLPGADGGAIDLLWLAPVLIAASTAFWFAGGSGATPDAALSRYVAAWRHDRPADAIGLFAASAGSAGLGSAVLGSAPLGSASGSAAPGSAGLGSAALEAIWRAQDARLVAQLTQLAASLGPDSGLDPTAPFDAVRFEVQSGSATTETVKVEIVRHETVPDTFLGIFPTTSDQVEPVASLGTVQLALVDVPPPWPGAPATSTWRIAGLNILGQAVGH